jgi:cytochrome c oxidase subunit 3/cytochrome c oxidase subunit I+III
MTAADTANTDLRLDDLPLDDSRGTAGMWLAITTEAFLFVSLFFAYFYVGARHLRWPESPPKREMALILLAVLAGSSVTVHLAERCLAKGARVAARLLLALTIAAGGVFLALQALEYRSRLSELWPTDDVYSSLFYVITSVHALHVIVGLGMLAFVLVQPRLEPAARPPHRPLHNAALYWHFVDVVWLFVVTLLYLLPHWAH